MRGSWEFLVIEKLLSINGKPECNDMDDDVDDDVNNDDDGDDDDDFGKFSSSLMENPSVMIWILMVMMMMMMIVILEVSSYRKIAFH